MPKKNERYELTLETKKKSVGEVDIEDLSRDIVEFNKEENRQLEDLGRQIANNNYLLLQNSPYMGDITKKLLSGQSTRKVAEWLIEIDPKHFSDVTFDQLQQQILRYRRVLMKKVTEDGDEYRFNQIDYEVSRFKDRAFIVQAMMERIVAMQESRVLKALYLEEKEESLQKKKKLSSYVAEEMDRYMGYLGKLGAYKKLMGKDDDGNSAIREMTHNFRQMQKVYDVMPPANKKKFREEIERLASMRRAQEGSIHKKPESSEEILGRLGRDLTEEEIKFMEQHG